MTATASATGRGGTIVSAVLGVLALLVSLAVIVLTDDDLDLPGGGSPSGLFGGSDGDGGGGGVSFSTGDGSNAEGRPGNAEAAPAPSPSACTETECPAVGPPTEPAGTFPYPPGTTDPVWTDDFCPDIWTSETKTVRQVRGKLNEIRDWYLTHLLDAGYGWGSAGVLHANPFNENDDVLGWDGPLTTNDDSALSGRLALERADGRQASCGPAKGVIFISVEQP